MKVQSVILILYILLLSSHPCCDETDSISANLTEHSPGDHSNSCNEVCSPFFTCGSCAGFSSPEYLSSINPELVLLDTAESTFCPPVDFDYINHIWQPPEIG